MTPIALRTAWEANRPAYEFMPLMIAAPIFNTRTHHRGGRPVYLHTRLTMARAQLSQISESKVAAGGHAAAAARDGTLNDRANPGRKLTSISITWEYMDFISIDSNGSRRFICKSTE